LLCSPFVVPPLPPPPPPPPPARRRGHLALLIEKAFTDSDGTYGYRRVHAQLARWDEHCTPELVRALMRALGLVACQPRPWRHSLTDQDPAAGPIPDLLHRDFTASAPGEKMVGDITYSAQLAVMCSPSW
jgi:putative transposase